MKTQKTFFFALSTIAILQSPSFLYPMRKDNSIKKSRFLLKTIKTSTKKIHTLDVGNKDTFVCTIANKATLLDLQDPQIKEKNQFTLDGEKTSITRFSPKGDKLAVKNGKNIKIITLSDGKTYAENQTVITELEDVNSFAWHPDNKHFAITKIFMLKLFEYAIENNIPKEVKTHYLEGYSNASSISFSPNGNYISYIGRKYFKGHEIGFVNLKTGKTLKEKLPISDDEKKITFIPQKNCLIIATNQGEKEASLDILSIKNDTVETIKKIPLTGHVECINCFTSGKSAVIATGEKINIVNLATGKIKHTLEGHTKKITNLKCTKNGKYIISTGKDYTIRIWKNPPDSSEVKKERLDFLREKKDILKVATLWKNAA